MPQTEQFVLAIFGGLGFGAIVHWYFHSSWHRLLTLLIVLWTLQTAPQYISRWLDGVDVQQEVFNIFVLRFVFTVTAVVTLALLNRYRVDRHG